MRIFLIGFMGCGKSTIGKKLARKISHNFVDLDRYIEAKLFKTIPEIFKEKGEDEFRRLEKKYLEEISAFENIVISVGGGTPCFYNNLEVMKNAGTVVYLKLEHKALVNRLKNSKRYDRPLLENLTLEELDVFVKDRMKDREQFYEKAHITINALSIDIKEMEDKIKQTSSYNNL